MRRYAKKEGINLPKTSIDQKKVETKQSGLIDNRERAKTEKKQVEAISQLGATNSTIQKKSLTNEGSTSSGPNISGGYDGKNIEIAKNASTEKTLLHELGHAVLNHNPQSAQGPELKSEIGSFTIDSQKEKEADRAGTQIADTVGHEGTRAMANAFDSMPGSSSTNKPKLPFLTDGFGTPLSPLEIAKLEKEFGYRHDEEEQKVIMTKIGQEQQKLEPKSLKEFVNYLKVNGDKPTQRAGMLLDLVLNQFQNWAGEPKNEPTGEEAWEGFDKAVKFIKHYEARINGSTDAQTEETPLLGKFVIPSKNLPYVLSIRKDQWQAAAVASMRSGILTYVGFLELKDALEEASKGTMSYISLTISKDVLHIANVNHMQFKTGTVIKPKYAAESNIPALNKQTGIFKSSGAYSEEDGVIMKELDFGHKAVDYYENFAHRSEGKQVDPKVNFSFLALLSPKPDSQEVIGANGAVLGDGSYMFTIDPSFRFRYMPAANFKGEGGINKNFFQFIPHSQLASLGKVVAAGNFVIKNGKFVWIDNGSGHYRVNASVNTANTKAALKNLGYDTAGIKFRNRAAGDLDVTYTLGNSMLERLPKGEHRPAMTPEIKAMENAMRRLTN